jgi:hypothetical protein
MLSRPDVAPMQLPTEKKINLHKNDRHILYRSVLLLGFTHSKMANNRSREREKNKKDEFLIFHDQITSNAEA